jgi:nucleolin
MMQLLTDFVYCLYYILVLSLSPLLSYTIMSTPAPSTLHPLVFDFLTLSGFHKAAKALAKEANVDFEASQKSRTSGPKLLDVYAAFLKAHPTAPAASPALNGKKRKAAASSDSSDSDSSDDEKPAVKKIAVTTAASSSKPVATPAKKSTAADSSSDDSSSDEDEAPAKKPAPTPAKKSPAVAPTSIKKAPLSDSSSSDSSDSDDDEKSTKPKSTPTPIKKAAIPPPANINGTVANGTSSSHVVKKEKPSESSDSDSDSSDDEATPAPPKTPVKKSPVIKPTFAKKPDTDSSSSSSDSDSDDEKPVVKTPFVTPAKVKSENGNGNGYHSNNGSAAAPRSSGKKTPNAPFQRVKVGDAPDLPEMMRDNSFSLERAGGYGALAQSKLGIVKGKRFQHEKTKGKRGNYRGGALDNEVRSIKFD